MRAELGRRQIMEVRGCTQGYIFKSPREPLERSQTLALSLEIWTAVVWGECQAIVCFQSSSGDSPEQGRAGDVSRGFHLVEI